MTLGIYVNPGLHSRKTFAERKRGETGCFSLVLCDILTLVCIIEAIKVTDPIW